MNIATLTQSFQFIYMFRTSHRPISHLMTFGGSVEIAARAPECLALVPPSPSPTPYSHLGATGEINSPATQHGAKLITSQPPLLCFPSDILSARRFEPSDPELPQETRKLTGKVQKWSFNRVDNLDSYFLCPFHF